MLNKDEFIEQFAQLGHRTEPSYENPATGYRVRYGRYDHEMVVLYMDAVPCDCGALECVGWKMHSKTLKPPSDCGVDPLMMHGSFGPPYSLMSREDQESVGLIPGDDGLAVPTVFPNRPDDEPGFGSGGLPPDFSFGPPDFGVASKEAMGLGGADSPFHWSFILDGKTVGELTFNEETKKLDFSGDAHASAQILFDLVTQRFGIWYEDKYDE